MPPYKPPMKPIVDSRTTRNVAIGGTAAAGVVAAGAAFARAMGYPLPEDAEIHLVWIVATLTPLISRVIAKVWDRK